MAEVLAQAAQVEKRLPVLGFEGLTLVELADLGTSFSRRSTRTTGNTFKDAAILGVIYHFV
jgi:hypothetical protein